jgi:hypothetical protein
MNNDDLTFFGAFCCLIALCFYLSSCGTLLTHPRSNPDPKEQQW